MWQYDFTSAPHVVYVAPDHSEDKGNAVPRKAQVAPQNVFNIYTQGKDAESLNQFVRQHTGFDVRCCDVDWSSKSTTTSLLTTCVC